MRRDGHTPKTYAQSCAITAINNVFRWYERYPDEIEGTPAFQRAVMVQLAKLHNNMLDKSGMDGLHLEPEERK